MGVPRFWDRAGTPNLMTFSSHLLSSRFYPGLSGLPTPLSRQFFVNLLSSSSSDDFATSSSIYLLSWPLDLLGSLPLSPLPSFSLLLFIPFIPSSHSSLPMKQECPLVYLHPLLLVFLQKLPSNPGVLFKLRKGCYRCNKIIQKMSFFLSKIHSLLPRPDVMYIITKLTYFYQGLCG